MNDYINLVYGEGSIENILIKSLDNPIKIKNAIITRDFDKSIVLKYYPKINFKYIEDIDSLYTKYIKYKTKYLKLKDQLGGSNITRMTEYFERISTHFSEKDVCTIKDITVYEMIQLTQDTGATKGFGGGFLLSGNVDEVPCVFKLLKINEEGRPDTNINEIGITHFISDYFLHHSNQKLTDNFITFFHSKRCADYLIKELDLNLNINGLVECPTSTNDINIMVVEKVDGDLGGYLKSILIPKDQPNNKAKEDEICKKLDIILFQIIYSLYIFNKEFRGFSHNDLHIGNILIKNEPNETKKYIIKKYFNGESEDPTEYNIEIPTYGFTPKIWDFATSVVKKVNDKIKSNDPEFITKYFNYKNDNKLITYNDYNPESKPNKDLLFLLNSINMLLSPYYHLPKTYLSDLHNDFFNNNIQKIFNIFLGKIDHSFGEKTNTPENCDYFFDDV